MDPYKVLQVDPEAEDEVIQAAYRRLAQKYHPDVAGPDAARKMAALNAAWEVLRDPGRRAELDRERRRTTASSSAPARESGAGTPSSRTARPGGPAPWQPADRAAPGSASRTDPRRPPETVSTDWTTGRSTSGGGYDPDGMRTADGL